jgi:murein DD-endopeptidase MepM/ murein hydrolase activator NlpD
MVAVVVGTRVDGGLDDSVGYGGINRFYDVGAVQELLQIRGFYKDRRIDRSCGPYTIAAIREFQKDYVMRNPDGLIQPGKRTWQQLINPALILRVGPPADATAVVLKPAVAAGQAAGALPAGIRWPLERNIIRKGAESNTFGEVRGNNVHQGWDFQADTGTPCYAIGSGKVVRAIGTEPDEYKQYSLGNIVIIKLNSSPLPDHPHLYVVYAHLKNGSVPEKLLKKDAPVDAGDIIGKAGVSGNCKYKEAWVKNGVPREEQHLHFEIRTKEHPGRLLNDRISPMKIFGLPPKSSPVISPLK